MSKKVFGLAFALLFTTVVVAQDAPKQKKNRGAAGGNNAATNVLKQLKDVGLTDEQKTKIEAMAKKSMTDMRDARKEAEITPELTKKRMAAQKELQESGKKGAELIAAVNEKAGITESQAKFFKKMAESRTALLKGAVALLTDEQKEKLPQRVKRMASGEERRGKGKGKGKKKKAE
jgi:hypothetical protein